MLGRKLLTGYYTLCDDERMTTTDFLDLRSDEIRAYVQREAPLARTQAQIAAVDAARAALVIIESEEAADAAWAYEAD